MKYRVKIYWNLHKKCFSVQYKGIVIAHKDTVCLENVEFKVSEAGRQRVLKNKRKAVHAFVCGDLQDTIEIDISRVKFVTYNPYNGPNFMANDKPIHVVNKAMLYINNNKGRIIVELSK